MNTNSVIIDNLALSPGAEATLWSVGVGVALSQFVLASEAGIAENIIQVGAPIAIGGAVANIGLKKKAETLPEYAQKGLLAGAVGTGVLMAAGALPVTFDAATLGFVGLVGSSVVVGDILATAIAMK